MASQYLPYIHIHIRLYARGSSGLFYRGPEDTSIAIDARNRIQVLNTMLDLGTAEKEQRAAFIVRIRLSLAPPFPLTCQNPHYRLPHISFPTLLHSAFP